MENIDHTEVKKFNDLAHEWWDPQGKFRFLHQLNPLRLQWICQQVELQGLEVLDVGCGAGILTETLALKGAKVTGIDAAKQVIAVAKLHARSENLRIEYHHTLVEDFAKTHQEKFDVITCMELLEHVPDPKAFVMTLASLLKPGGYLFLSTLHRHPKAYFLGIVMAEYVLNFLPKGTHDYAKFIKPSELASYLRTAGCSLHETTGLIYHPFKKMFSLSKRDLSVNYLMSAFKPPK